MGFAVKVRHPCNNPAGTDTKIHLSVFSYRYDNYNELRPSVWERDAILTTSAIVACTTLAKYVTNCF